MLSSDNQYLINAINPNLPIITYEKQKAKEQKINFDNFASMDTKSFNSPIGGITNMASTLIAMKNNFNADSKEYKEICKRIDLLRRTQGDAIDATKGMTYTPPPKHWSKKQRYMMIPKECDDEKIKQIQEYNENVSFNNKICADKKPYFFGYVYPKYMEEYNRHRSNYKKMSKLIFDTDLYSLISKQNKNSEEKRFIYNYYKHMPLMKNNCIMNVLAEYVEDTEFQNKWNKECNIFDYKTLTSEKYSIDNTKLYNQIKKIIFDFNKRYDAIIREKKTLELIDKSLIDDDVSECYSSELSNLIQEYENILYSICSDGYKLCDYVVDIYYNCFKNKSKFFIWSVFGEFILNNIKSKSNKVCFPILDDNGTEYLGKKYSIREVDFSFDCV